MGRAVGAQHPAANEMFARGVARKRATYSGNNRSADTVGGALVAPSRPTATRIANPAAVDVALLLLSRRIYRDQFDLENQS